jgi:pimeloyl-[acyl-carrier protein] methyl ester esterase
MQYQSTQLSESTDFDIVFLHGWGMNHGIWQPFSELVRAEYGQFADIKCFDLPGFGLAHQNTLPDYSLEQLAQFIANKLVKPTILIGWSMGGLVAQQLANEAHPLVIAHAQIASTPRFTESADWPGIKPAVLTLFAKQLKIDHQTLLHRFLALQNMGLDKPKFSVKQMLDLLTQYPSSTPKTLESSLSILHTTDLRDELGKSKLPCLRLYGELDSLVPHKAVDKIQSLCKNSHSVIIDKASHAPFLSHPSVTFEHISSFLFNEIGLSNKKS